MRRSHIGMFIILLFVFGFLPTMGLLSGGRAEFNLHEVIESSGYFPNSNHAVIDLEGNDEIDTFFSGPGSIGSGTPTDPYVIRDLIIDTDGVPTGHGIQLQDTDRFITIMNVTIYEDAVSTLYFNALYLDNASNILVQNCTFFHLGGLVDIFDSNNVNITGDIVIYDIVGRFYCEFSNNIILSGIRVEDSTGFALLYFSNNVTIENINVEGWSSYITSSYGVRSQYSNHITIRDFTCSILRLGIDFYKGGNLTVSNFNIEESTYGILTTLTGDIELNDISIEDCSLGAFFNLTNTIKIDQIALHDCITGIALNGNSSLTPITNTTIINIDIDGRSDGSSQYGFYGQYIENLTVQDLEVQHYASGDIFITHAEILHFDGLDLTSQVYINSTDNVTIKDGIFNVINPSNYCLDLQNISNVSIINCVFGSGNDEITTLPERAISLGGWWVGIEISGCNFSATDAGIQNTPSNTIAGLLSIDNCNFWDIFYGINIAGTPTDPVYIVNVTNSDFIGCSIGILMENIGNEIPGWGLKINEVNIEQAHYYGIVVGTSGYFVVANSTISDTSNPMGYAMGLVISDCDEGGLIQGNELYNNAQGYYSCALALEYSQAPSYDSAILIDSNIITRNDYTAVYMRGCDFVNLTNNLLSSNVKGTGHISDMDIVGSVVYWNEGANTYNLTMFNNSIYGNPGYLCHVEYTGPQPSNTIFDNGIDRGNYWSDYTEVTSDPHSTNGITYDDPYNVVMNQYDHYPLVLDPNYIAPSIEGPENKIWIAGTGIKSVQWITHDLKILTTTYAILINGTVIEAGEWPSTVSINLDTDVEDWYGAVGFDFSTPTIYTINITLQVSDGLQNATNSMFITLSNAPANFISSPNNQFMTVGSLTTLEWEWNDASINGPNAIAQLLELTPGGFALLDSWQWGLGTISKSLPLSMRPEGNYTFKISLDDGFGLLSEHTVNVLINAQPVITSAVGNSYTHLQGVQANLTWFIQDNLAPNAVYQILRNDSSVLEGDWISGSTITISIADLKPGSYNFTVAVSDGYVSEFHTIILTVSSVPLDLNWLYSLLIGIAIGVGIIGLTLFLRNRKSNNEVRDQSDLKKIEDQPKSKKEIQ